MRSSKKQMPTCTVYFRAPDGRLAGHTTEAETLFEACRNALAWFADPDWQGPRPTEDTILEVQVVSRAEKWRVRTGFLKSAAPKQDQQASTQEKLFDTAPGALDPQR